MSGRSLEMSVVTNESLEHVIELSGEKKGLRNKVGHLQAMFNTGGRTFDEYDPDIAELLAISVAYGEGRIFNRGSELLCTLLDEHYSNVRALLEVVTLGGYPLLKKLIVHLSEVASIKNTLWTRDTLKPVKLYALLYGCSELRHSEVFRVLAEILMENSHVRQFRVELFKIFSYFVRNEGAKEEFAENDLMKLYLSVVHANSDTIEEPEILYYVVFVLWITSFETRTCMRLSRNSAFLEDLLMLLKQLAKENVVRMVIGTLNNILDKNENVATFLLMNSGMRVLQALKGRNMKDEELHDGLELLSRRMNDCLMKINAFWFTKKLIEEERLEWLPIYRNEGFWKENIIHFEENDFYLVKRLKDILTSGDARQRPIACHILGSFLCYHPLGREYAEKFGLKQIFLDILGKSSDADPDLQKEALLASQKLMLLNWKKLQVIE